MQDKKLEVDSQGCIYNISKAYLGSQVTDQITYEGDGNLQTNRTEIGSCAMFSVSGGFY